MGGIGREHQASGLAAGLVVGPCEQHARELAVGAGGGLQADVRQAGDLPERTL